MFVSLQFALLRRHSEGCSINPNKDKETLPCLPLNQSINRPSIPDRLFQFRDSSLAEPPPVHFLTPHHPPPRHPHHVLLRQLPSRMSRQGQRPGREVRRLRCTSLASLIYFPIPNSHSPSNSAGPHPPQHQSSPNQKTTAGHCPQNSSMTRHTRSSICNCSDRTTSRIFDRKSQSQSQSQSKLQ